MASPSNIITRSVKLLPTITIQHDLLSVRDDISQGLHSVEDVWCSCYHQRPSSSGAVAQNSVHGKLRMQEPEEEGTGAVEIIGRDGVFVESDAAIPTRLMIACPELQIAPTSVQFPFSTTTIFAQKQGGAAIDAVTISVDGRLCVIGAKGGKLRLGETSRLNEGMGSMKELRGHVSDITSASFFASDRLIMTTSADMSMKIFSSAGVDLLTLTGHTRSVTSAHIVSLSSTATNIISASLDGTIRLWQLGLDGSEGSLVRTMKLDRPILDMAILEKAGMGEERTVSAIVGYSNGTASIINLSSSLFDPAFPSTTSATIFFDCSTAPLLSTGSKSAITCIATISISDDTYFVAIGNQSGEIVLFQLSHLLHDLSPSPVVTFKRSSATSSAPITSIHISIPPSDFSAMAGSALSKSSLVVLLGTSDGLPYRAIVEYSPIEGKVDVVDDVRVDTEFAGLDCDSAVITAVRPSDDRGEVWVGGGDGCLRRFS